MFTIFPGIFEGPLRESLLGRAVAEGLVEVHVARPPRLEPPTAHRSVDDESFGGGPGMVMRPEPVFAAVESLDPDRGRVLVALPGRPSSRPGVRP